MAASSRPGAGPAVLVPLAAAFGIAAGVTVLMVTIYNYLVGPIAAEFGVSKATVTGALSLHLAMLIFSLPIAGVVADRIGARRTILGSALLFGAALAGAACASGIAAFYAALAVAGIVGAGASPIGYARAIVHRFDARRGLALGVALSGTGLGGVLLPMIVQPIVAGHGWRDGLLAAAAVTAATGALAALLIGDERRLPAATATTGRSLGEAAATPAFWLMTLAFALLGVALAGFVSHLSEFWSALGFDPAGVPRFQATVGIATIAGRLAGGALMDRVPARFVGAGAAAAGAIGLAALAAGVGGPGLIGVAVAVGLCTGTESDVISYLSSRLFGVRQFARIYAAQGSFFIVGFAIGPLAASLAMHDVGERATLFLGAAVLTASTVMLLVLGGYERQIVEDRA